MNAIKYETIKESIEAYKKYIDDHIKAVRYAAKTFGLPLAKAIEEKRDSAKEFNGYYQTLYNVVNSMVVDHDASKYEEYEFDQYRRYFYPSKEDLNTYTKDQINEDFNKAWFHHYNNNDHHPEYWSYLSTNKESNAIEKIYCKMPNSAFMEMILDWIGVSIVLKSNVLDWWENSNSGKAEKMKMLDKEDIDTIEYFFHLIPNALDFTNCDINLDHMQL